MKKTVKRMALCLAAVLAAAALAGCAATPPASAPPASGTEATAPAVTQQPQATEQAPAEKTVISIWTKDRHDADFMQEKISAYNATNTDNIEVKYEIYSDNYVQAVDMVFASGEAPDIFVMQEQVFSNYVNAGKYADLTPLMDDEFKETFGDLMFEGINVMDGKCYYVPTAATTSRLFYNKDIFKRVGLPGPPQTLEQMVEYAEKITAELSGEGIYGFAANLKNATSALSRSLSPMAEREVGTRIGFDFAKGEYNFNNYAGMLTSWKALLSPACAFPGVESLDIDPLRTQFAAGKIGMYFSFTHAEPGVYANQFPMEQEWGCAQIPTSGGKVTGAQNYTAMNGYMFNAESKNLEAAWKVYRDVLTNLDVLTEYYEKGLGISLVPAVTGNASPAAYYLDNPDLLIGQGDRVWPKAPHELNPDAVVVEGLNNYDTFASMIIGDQDIEKGLADLTDRYNAAYRAGIAQGLGTDLTIAGFNPLQP